MLHPELLRELLVDPSVHPRGQRHLSAASGLVKSGSTLYFIADDEHHLGTLPIDAPASTLVRMHRLIEGDLPSAPQARKKEKPDLEVLLLLPDGSLLAFGSGSRPNRERGFVVQLDAQGIPGAVRVLDLAPLYRQLHGRFADLNIEGAFVSGGDLCLLQRGNRGGSPNASIRVRFDGFAAWLQGQAPAPGARMQVMSLPDVDGVPYGFTDGAALPDGGWLFSAVAEDTRDSFGDGGCMGSAIGRVSAAGELAGFLPLHGAPKVEGIARVGEDRLLLVTDADDPVQASALLQVRLPAGW